MFKGIKWIICQLFHWSRVHYDLRGINYKYMVRHCTRCHPDLKLCTWNRATPAKISGPYYTGQQPDSCGCYFPDVVRVRDDCQSRNRTFDCINHGEIIVGMQSNVVAISGNDFMPTDEWRKKERKRLQQMIVH